MRLIYFILFIFLMIFISCKQSATGVNSKIGPDQLDYSAADSVEAFELALWFEGNLLPSDETIKDCLFSLNYLRYTFGNTIPVLDQNRFMLPWTAGKLKIWFDDSTAVLVRNHQYYGWNQLEAHLRPDTLLRYPDERGFASIGFEEPYNPIYLSELYKNLPGIELCEPSRGGFIGVATYPIIPGYNQNGMSYVFVEDNFTISNYYYYFKYINGEPIFVGMNNLSDQINPDWWSEVFENFANFGIWQGP